MSSIEDSQPPSFEDLGIPIVSHTRVTALGKIRSLASLDRLEWAFLVGSLLATLATAGLGTARLLSLPPQSDDRVFVWLLLLTAGFALVYSVNGVLREQVYELLVYALTAAVLAVYVLLNYLDPDTPRGAIKLARLVVAGLCSPPLVVAAVTLAGRYWQCGELVFRTVGANPALQRACRRVLTAQSLLKLDAQLALSTARWRCSSASCSSFVCSPAPTSSDWASASTCTRRGGRAAATGRRGTARSAAADRPLRAGQPAPSDGRRRALLPRSVQVLSAAPPSAAPRPTLQSATARRPSLQPATARRLTLQPVTAGRHSPHRSPPPPGGSGVSTLSARLPTYPS